MGYRIRPAATFNDSLPLTVPTQIFTRQLSNGDIAVGCYNRGTIDLEHPHNQAPTGPPMDCSFTFAEIGFPAAGKVRFRIEESEFPVEESLIVVLNESFSL